MSSFSGNIFFQDESETKIIKEMLPPHVCVMEGAQDLRFNNLIPTYKTWKSLQREPNTLQEIFIHDGRHHMEGIGALNFYINIIYFQKTYNIVGSSLSISYLIYANLLICCCFFFLLLQVSVAEVTFT